MAKLNLPIEQPVGGLQKLDPSGGQQAATSGAAIGNVAQQFGAGLVQQNQEYFNQARDAIDNSLATTAYSRASVEYAQAVQDRMSQMTDANGMPTFESLGADISKIGEEIGSKYGGMLVSPGASAAFNKQFGGLKQQQEISALSAARSQQIDFGRAALNAGIDTATNSAIAGDPAQSAFHMNNAVASIDQAVRDGLITAQEAQIMKEQMRKNVTGGQAFIANSKDPRAVQAELEKGNTFGLDPVELQKFKNENERQIKILEDQEKAKEKEIQNQIATQQQAATKDLELGMSQGTVTATDIEQSYQNGQISHNQRADLLIKFNKSQGETAQKQQTQNAISSAITSGSSLHQFTSTQINSHYENAIAIASLDANGQPTKKLTIQEKADIASQYKAPVTDLTQELNSAILSGSPSDAASAVQAIDALNKKNPVAISQGMSSEARAIAAVISLNRFTNTPLERVIQEARDQVLNKDQSQIAALDGKFKTIEAFKPENINSTIVKAMDPGVLTIGPDQLDPKFTPILEGLLKEGFKQTGTEAGAIAYFQKSISSTFGTTQINAGPKRAGWTDNSVRTVTYLPVEKQYPQYDLKTIRADLDHDVQEIAAQYGVTPQQIQIRANASADPTPGKTKYDLYWTDTDGVEHPITNEFGVQATWAPNTDELDAERQTQFINSQLEDKAAQEGGIVGWGIQWIKDHTSSKVPASPEVAVHKNIAAAIAHVESGGAKNPYQALGPVMSGGQYKGERALGKYQIMPGNLPAWSKEAVGRVVSPSEFMRNPALQDQIAEYQIKKLYEKYGNPQDVMSVWLTGRPLKKGGNARDLETGISGSEYTAKAMDFYNNHGGSAKTDSSGDPMIGAPPNLNSEGGATTNVPRVLDLIDRSVGSMIYDVTSSLSGTAYGFGSKNPKSGSVDCSGLVAFQTLEVMKQLNAHGANYDLNFMRKVMNQPAAMQIALIGAKAGFITRKDLNAGAVRNGTIIGIRRAKVPSWAANRPYGISHVVQVVERDGKKYISESVGSKGGVALTPYDQWMKANAGTMLYATNPFNLQKVN